MITNPKVIRNIEGLQQDQKVLFSKTYPKENLEFSLSKLSLPGDWPLIFKWISEYTSKTKQILKNQQEIKQAFTSITSTNYALSYLCQLNNKPIAQVDLLKYSFNEMFPYFQCQQGDHGLKILTSPKLSNQKYTLIPVIKFCLEYLFSNKKVNRLIFQTDLENEKLNESIVETGFGYATTVQLEFYKANIYTCSRASYLNKYCQKNKID